MICVVCMSLVRIFSDFKRVCFATQNDLWKMDQNNVIDRGNDVLELITKAKQTVTPGFKPSPGSVQSTQKTVDMEFVSVNPQPKVILKDTMGETNISIEKPPPNISDQVKSFSTMKKRKSPNKITENILLKSPSKKFVTSDLDYQMITEEFEDTEMIEEHLEEEAYVELKPTLQFMCTENDCIAVFETKEMMDDHKKREHIPEILEPPSEYECQVCKENFIDIAHLVYHRKTNHFPKKCGFCAMVIPSESFVAHRAQCRKEKAKAMGLLDTIRIGTQKKTELVDLAPDANLFKCGKCNQSFQTIDVYKIHYKQCTGMENTSGDL